MKVTVGNVELEICPRADLCGADLKGAIFVDGWVISRQEVSDE